MIFAFIIWIVVAITAGRIGVKKGYPVAGYLLGFFLAVLGLIVVLLMDDKGETAQISKETANADALLKYKQLLDEGVITEEEFNEKKWQILNK